MSTKIKICGVTSPEIAAHAIHSGADAIGLMLYEGSKRFVTIDQALAINRAVTPFASQVGVVVNPDADYLNGLLDSVHIDYIQFHGDESAEFCRSFGRPYIRAVRVKPDTDLLEMEKQFDDAAAILLDTFSEEAYGGTGAAFKWEKASYGGSMPIILAGGLNPENVRRAIETASPYGVDISSGVETEGEKDPEKITEFCRNVLHLS